MRAPVRRRPAPRKKRRGRWSRRLAFILIVFIALSAGLVLPLRWWEPPTTAFMLQDDSGRVPVLYTWEPWEMLGEAAPLAVVGAEDQRFAVHFGIDMESIADAVDDAESGKPLRGASTITQQLAKNLFLWPGRSYLRKGIEAWFTVLLEATLPKRRILELYLNIVELGPGLYGFPAASRLYFDKSVANLTAREAALLAAVLPNPHRLRADSPTPYLRERQAWIYAQMQRLQREGWLTLL